MGFLLSVALNESIWTALRRALMLLVTNSVNFGTSRSAFWASVSSFGNRKKI